VKDGEKGETKEGVDGSAGPGAGIVPCYGNYCGPGHPVDTAHLVEPIDELDRVCEMHDACYEAGVNRADCDGAMANEISEIEEPASMWGKFYMSVADKYMDAVGSNHKLSLVQLMEQAEAEKNPRHYIQEVLKEKGISAREAHKLSGEVKSLMLEKPKENPPLLLLESENKGGRKGRKGRKGPKGGQVRISAGGIVVGVGGGRRRGKRGGRKFGKFKKSMRKQRMANRKVVQQMTIQPSSAAMLHPLKRVRPSKRNRDGERIIGTDILFSFTTDATAAHHDEGSQLLTFPLSPGDSAWNNTRLKQYLPLYQKFRFRKFRLRYYPIANRTVSGQIVMYIDSDTTTDYSSIESTFAAIQTIMARTGERPCQISEERSTRYVDSLGGDPDQTFFNYPAAGSATTDPRLYSQGRAFVFAVSDLPNSTACGVFVAEYDIELFGRAVKNDLVSSSQSAINDTDGKGYGTHVCYIAWDPDYSGHTVAASANPTVDYLLMGASTGAAGSLPLFNASTEPNADFFRTTNAQGIVASWDNNLHRITIQHWPLSKCMVTAQARMTGTTDVIDHSLYGNEGPTVTVTQGSVTQVSAVGKYASPADGKGWIVAVQTYLTDLTPGTDIYLTWANDLGTVNAAAGTMSFEGTLIICGENKQLSVSKCGFEETAEHFGNKNLCKQKSHTAKRNCFAYGRSCAWCAKQIALARMEEQKEKEEKAHDGAHELLSALKGLLVKPPVEKELSKQETTRILEENDIAKKYYEEKLMKARRRALLAAELGALPKAVKKGLAACEEFPDDVLIKDEVPAIRANAYRMGLTEKK